jgi:hypothetical protein
MELLIPGLILVGLMVYASTRLKRTTARAFEAETIETPHFVINKPDGMLHVINGDPAYAFEAYSKEFGTVVRRDVRLATATIRIKDGQDHDDAVGQVSERNEVIGDHRYHITESHRVKDGAEFHILRKSAERDGRTIELEVSALEETPQDFMRKLETMVNSFVLVDPPK